MNMVYVGKIYTFADAILVTFISLKYNLNSLLFLFPTIVDNWENCN